MLKSMLSAEQCARCRICCSFVEDDVWEAPILIDTDTKEKYRAEYHFKNKEEILLCPKLDENKGCTLGEEKPFECKIWPLRPFMSDGQIKIGVSTVCPAFTEESDGRLKELLDMGLYDTIVNECKKNPEIIRVWDESYRIIV